MEGWESWAIDSAGRDCRSQSTSSDCPQVEQEVVGVILGIHKILTLMIVRTRQVAYLKVFCFRFILNVNCSEQETYM